MSTRLALDPPAAEAQLTPRPLLPCMEGGQGRHCLENEVDQAHVGVSLMLPAGDHAMVSPRGAADREMVVSMET